MKKNKSEIIKKILIVIVLSMGIAIVILIGNDNLKFNASADEEHTYVNKKYGFSYYYEGYSMDDSMETIKTVFRNEASIIEIYYDNFTNTIHNTRGYLNYSNQSIQKNDYIDQIEKAIYPYNNHLVQIISWRRKPLEHLQDKYTHFLSLEIVKSNTEVYTILVKSEEKESVEEVLSRFNTINKESGSEVTAPNFSNVDQQNMEDKTWEYYKSNFVQKNNEIMWGIFEPTTINSLNHLLQIEEKLNYDFKVLLQYYDLNHLPEKDQLQQVYDQGRVVELTLQTSLFGLEDQNIMLEVMDGKYDQQLEGFVRIIKELEEPVLFRLNNEMNGDWCVYNALHYQKDTSLYREFWRYIYNLFDKREVKNVIWIWNPNGGDFPSFKWNHYLNYFPGVEYVDILGITGYNTGNYYEGEVWREFKEIYDPLMDEYERIFDYPMIITEFGSNEVGGDKRAWMERMFNEISNYNVKLAIWFNGTDLDGEGNPARIYKFDHNDEYINEFKEGLKKFQIK